MTSSSEELLLQKYNKINFYKKMILLSTKENSLGLIKDIERLTIQIEGILEYNKEKNTEKQVKKDTIETVFSFRTREFTMKELSTYNGVGDNHAYIAVNGTVYDITGEKALNQIVAAGFRLGTDLSEQFNSGKLSKQLLNNIRIVGVLRD
jgi:predicted heme/steroid binding protein